MDKIIPIFGTSEIKSFFDEEQQTKLANAQPNITKAFETVTMWRTPTLLRLSVLDDVSHPTPDSKYWQLVNEMYAHSTGLAELMFEIEEKQIDLDEVIAAITVINKKIEKGEKIDQFELSRLEVKKRRYEFDLVNMQKTAKARIEELNNQSSAMEELKPLLAFGVEDQNAHQLQGFAQSWTSEVCNITEHTDVDSKKNIISRWITCMNVLNSMGKRDEFINSLPSQQKEKLRQLKLISGGKK